jgi:PLP dependent protein
MNDRAFIERISAIYKKMSHAAMRAGRNPEDVVLIAVTKTIDVRRIREAIDAGLRIFGENRVQEARAKIRSLTGISESLHWHLIGHLQRNKAKYAVRMFDLIHSLDSIDLAGELNRQASLAGKVQDVLIEVKLSPEKTKQGIPKHELSALLGAVREMQHLNLRGLMTMPPFFPNPQKGRPYFRELRELRDTMKPEGFSLPELSMGMSHDFEVAIQEGATMVRIGTAIFGEGS